jgi:hypothetical protein
VRYSNENEKIDTGSWTKHHRPKSKKTRKRGLKSKSGKPSRKNRITLVITVITKPQADCRIFNYQLAQKLVDRKKKIPLNKTNQFREEYVAQGTLHGKDITTPYTIRFTNSKFLELAKLLRPGTLIQAAGYFTDRKGRTTAEFVVKEFEVIAR